MRSGTLEHADAFEIADRHLSHIRAGLRNGDSLEGICEDLADIFQRLGDPEGQALAREILRTSRTDDCLDALEAALEMARHA